MRRRVELEQDVAREERVIRYRNRGDELQRSGLADRGRPDMWIHLHAVGMRERDDVAAGGEAAGNAEIRLRNIQRPMGEQVAEAEGGVLVLAAGDWRRERAAHFGIAVGIFLR